MIESPSSNSPCTLNLRGREPAPPPARFEANDPATLDAVPVSPSARLSGGMPQRVGNYDLIEEIGRGGMGVVYKARHRDLGRTVAIKMILGANFACADDRIRFRLEGEAAACLQHPNIVQVYEVGTHEDQPYLALEYVEGGTLSDRLKQAGLLLDQATRLVETLARAVHVAHNQGIIHRDLKPGNILLSFSREPPASAPAHALAGGSRLNESVPKITDFGLAKQLGREGITLTGTGHVLGTPEYMAPEQAASHSHQIGPHTDVYSLGVILYELLVGHPPFEFQGQLEAMFQLIAADPPPPRRLNARIPIDLETICLKCLQKEPTKRYPSAYELAEDLRRFRQNLPIQARPVGPVERVCKWARRRPVVAALVASLVVVSLLGFAGVSAALVYALEGWHQADTQRDLVEEERIAAEGERGKAEFERGIAQKERDKSRQAVMRERQARERAETNVAFSRLARALLEWRQNNLSASQDLLAQIDEKRRGWEWGYLDSLHHGELQGFTRPAFVLVGGLSFHPNGKQLAVAGGNPYHQLADGGYPSEVAIWDLAGGRVERVLKGLRASLYHLAYSPDGKYLAAFADWSRIHVWESDSGKLVRVIKGTFGAARELTWSPDGKELYAACVHTGIFSWEIESGNPVRRLQFGTSKGHCVAVSPNGRFLAGTDTDVRLWDRISGKQLWSVPKTAQMVAFSPDSRWLACASVEVVRLYDVSNGRQVRSLGGHYGPVSSLAFSPCGQLLVTGGADATVRLWDVEDGRELSLWRGHHGRVHCVAFHPGGALVVSGSGQPGEVKVWDLTRKQESLGIADFVPHRPVHALAFDPSGAEVLLQRSGGAVEVRDANTGMIRSSRQLPLTGAWRTPGSLGSLSGDTRVLAAVDAEANGKRVRLWDPRSGKVLPGSHTHRFPVWQVTVNHDGGVVASAAMDPLNGLVISDVAVWEPATEAVRFTRQLPGVPVTSLALSPDSRRLAIGIRGKESVADPKGGKAQQKSVSLVEVWDVGAASGDEPLLRIRVSPAMLLGLVFSADGSTLVGSTVAGEVFAWELPSGRPVAPEPLRGSAGLEGLAFSPDGRLLAGVNRNLVTVWDIRERQEVLRLRGAPPRPGDGGYSPRVAWSRDGRKLAASNWDHSVSVWEAPGATEQEKWAGARERLPRWHLEIANKAMQRNAFSAVRFHLDKVAPEGELDAGWCLLRGDLYARLGEWDKARADYQRAMPDVGTHQSDACRKYLMLRLRSGDLAGHRDWSRKLLAGVTEGSNWLTGSNLVLAAAAVEGAVDDPAALVELASEMAGRQPNDPLVTCAQALALLRAGRYTEAAAKARQLLPGEDRSRELPIQGWLMLTLANQRRGDGLLAGYWLHQAQERLVELRRQMSGNGRVTPEGIAWWEWLLIEQLEGEALAR